MLAPGQRVGARASAFLLLLLLQTLPHLGSSPPRVLELLVLGWGLGRGQICLGLELGSDLEPALGLWRDLDPKLTSATSLELGPGLELELEPAHESLICLELGPRQGPRDSARLLLLPLQTLLSRALSTP